MSSLTELRTCEENWSLDFVGSVFPAYFHNEIILLRTINTEQFLMVTGHYYLQVYLCTL
jgi:hypothetical protein